MRERISEIKLCSPLYRRYSSLSFFHFLYSTGDIEIQSIWIGNVIVKRHGEAMISLK